MAKRKDPTFEEIKVRLVRHFKPLEMYLFGPRANNTHKPSSDYDILLVVKKAKGFPSSSLKILLAYSSATRSYPSCRS